MLMFQLHVTVQHADDEKEQCVASVCGLKLWGNRNTVCSQFKIFSSAVQQN